MGNEIKYQLIAENNNDLLIDILEYMHNLFNINILDITNNSKYYIKMLLTEVFNNNNQSIVLRLERKNKIDDLKWLEASSVKATSYDGVAGGRNEGGKINHVELRLIKVEELREEINSLVLKSLLLEKSLNDKNELIRRFINLLPQRQYVAILECAYFKCKSTTDIALDLDYSYEYVKKVRTRAILVLADILSRAKISGKAK